MAQYETFADAAMAAIETQLAETGGGMLTGFLGVATFIDAKGEPSLVLMEMADQLTAVSMGLNAYMTESLAMDCRNQLSCFVDSDDDD